MCIFCKQKCDEKYVFCPYIFIHSQQCYNCSLYCGISATKASKKYHLPRDILKNQNILSYSFTNKLRKNCVTYREKDIKKFAITYHGSKERLSAKRNTSKNRKSKILETKTKKEIHNKTLLKELLSQNNLLTEHNWSNFKGQKADKFIDDLKREEKLRKYGFYNLWSLFKSKWIYTKEGGLFYEETLEFHKKRACRYLENNCNLEGFTIQ